MPCKPRFCRILVSFSELSHTEIDTSQRGSIPQPLFHAGCIPATDPDIMSMHTRLSVTVGITPDQIENRIGCCIELYHVLV